MTSHLVIPDPHAHPDYHNDRFEWLGNLVVDLKPDVVVCIGDWADMPSLCSYDKGTKGFEGRRYSKDIVCAVEAQDRFFAPIKRQKKKLPRFVMLEGNHEHRIVRAISNDAAHLDGIISLDDLQFAEYGWEFYPYRGANPDIMEIDGIHYGHFFPSGVMGRPIGGERPALQLINKHHISAVQGHIHVADYCIRTSARGRHIMGLVCGVYQEWQADFAGHANDLWWRGVCFLDNVNDGVYDLSMISMHSIKKEYRK